MNRYRDNQEMDWNTSIEDDGEGRKLKGILKSVEGRNFTITTQEKVKVEGKKRPQLADVDHQLSMDTAKYCKYLIKF